MNFSEFELDPRIIDSLTKIGFVNPTLIQTKTIPKALDRSDIIGIAPTGTGKTLAFIIPSLHWLFHAKITHQNPSILILVPTRELIKQIQDVIKRLTKSVEVTTAGIYSGQRIEKQYRSVQGIIDIIIATPGRLLKFLHEKNLIFENLSLLILDEVDRLLDMGFRADIEKILEFCPHKNKRQTMMFGSTLPSEVEAFARQIQSNSIMIDVGRSMSPQKIVHEVYEVDKDKKLDILIDLLHQHSIRKVLIFTKSKDTARITTRNLLKQGLEVEEFHGGLTQTTRNHALANFNSGQVDVMVATDIAARGLDFVDLSHVINFDVPRNYDDYIHRAGRTGRIYKAGISCILASPEEFNQVKNIEKKLNQPLIRKLRMKKSKQGKVSQKRSTFFVKKKVRRKSRKK
ncbi:MAG: DEAD/DEAH box helicase [Candidatus Kariarchaeaceae archaeon]|jgi:ATP-dependent RNA helicase RhlE